MKGLKGIICIALTLLFTNITFGENTAIQPPKNAITVKGNLNLGITVYLQKIQNNAEIILHSGCNEWIMLPDGGIVLKNNPKFGLTVKQQMIKNDSRIILHEGYNKWKILPNGAIVLKNNPKFGLTVNQQNLKNNSLIILHEGYNKWSSNLNSSTTNSNSTTNANPKPKPIKVTGQDAVYIEYAQNGKVIGHFKEISPNTWGEFKKGKAEVHATFQLSRRGPWSVFLYDKSRGMNLTLNLHTKAGSIGGNKFCTITKTRRMEWFPYSPPENTSTVSYSFTLQTMNLTKFPKRVKNNYDYSEAYYVSYAPNKNITIVNALERSTIDWDFENAGNGYYRLRSAKNSYLSVHNSGKADGTNLKNNAKLGTNNQLFRFEQNAQGNIRIVSRLGNNLYLGHANVSNGIGNLVLRNGDKGYNTTFKLIPRRTISSKASGTLELFAEQYAAPVSNKPVTQAELNGFHTIVYRDGILQQVSGQKDWVRLDGNKKVVDVLKEVSRRGGQIYLKTYNSFVYDFPLNLAASHEAYYDININMEMKRVEKFQNSYTGKSSISAVSDKYYDLGKSGTGTTCKEFRVITFRGMVTLAYATNNVWGKSDKMCSGPAANREKQMFKSACLEHDKNWAAPWKLADYNNETGQSISDAIFLIDLKGIVDDSDNPIDHTAVGFFYRGVRATKQGNSNYEKGRQYENQYHRVIFTAEKKTKDILTNIVDEEYSEDMIDYIFIGGEAVKNFFEDDVADFFSDMF